MFRKERPCTGQFRLGRSILSTDVKLMKASIDHEDDCEFVSKYDPK